MSFRFGERSGVSPCSLIAHHPCGHTDAMFVVENLEATLCVVRVLYLPEEVQVEKRD